MNSLARLLAGLPPSDDNSLGWNALTARIPQKGALSPEQEAGFQAFMAFDPNVRDWRNSFVNRFGEQPNTETDPTFDYRKAWQAGEAPKPYGPDAGFPHWGSAGKRPGHPTAWMNDFMQRFGVDPMTLRPEQVTPEMQAFMHAQIGRYP